jgi:hypothetical protein
MEEVKENAEKFAESLMKPEQSDEWKKQHRRIYSRYYVIKRFFKSYSLEAVRSWVTEDYFVIQPKQ